MPRWAILMTTHQRLGITRRCLDALDSQCSTDVELALYVTDAGSTDCTPEFLDRRGAGTMVIRRGADLFWDGGMRVSFAHAFSEGHDAYLWLNDDTVLDPDALARLRETSLDVERDGQGPAIVCGATRGTHDGNVTYSGLCRTSRFRPMAFSRVMPANRPRRVETMNGNCVLIPHAVARAVGNIDRRLTHAMGDIDYGLRARHKGFDVWLAPGTIGTCDANPPAGPRPLLQEARALLHPKGLPPRDWATMTLRWAGPAFPVAFVSPYLRRALSSLRYGLR